MKPAFRARYLALIGLALLLVGMPAAILAAGPGGPATSQVYLPFLAKPGWPGATGTLENGGAFEGPGGVGIGALTDTLAAPIQVSIAVTLAPTTTLPVQAQALGDFYQIGAGEDAFVATGSPFILAFPIPVGANPAHLALAMLQPGDGVLDVDGRGAAWAFLEGRVDPAEGLFLTTIAGLTEAGNIFSLAEHPDFDSPPNDGPRRGGARSPLFDLFTVRCVHFIDPTQCTDATESLVAGYLTDIFDRIHQELGFNEPRLRYMDETLAYNPHSFSTLGYSAYIEPETSSGCFGNDGYYSAASGMLVLCLDPVVGITPDSLYVLIHEFFHATQYGYLEAFADFADGSREKWVVEGTATSAMESYFVDEMLRTDFFLPEFHYADVSLKSEYEHFEYLTQDFWVYYGQRTGLDLSYLRALLEEGLSSQAVVDALDSGEFLGMYWDWAKNHVMEPAVDYDGMLGTPCQLETPVVVLPEVVSVGGYSAPFHDVYLEPLDSVVVDLRWDWDGYNFADGVVFPVPNQEPTAELALRYKFYKEGEAFCETIPDGRRIFQDPDPAARYYLLISNIDHDDPYAYRIRFEYDPYPPRPAP